MTQKIILTCGLPASGKSTWAKEQVGVKDSTWKRINKDDLRTMINGGVWSKGNETAVVAARDAMIRTFLSQGYSVIVDDTNVQDVHIKSIYHLVATEFPHVEFEVMHFDVDVAECIRRDPLRDAKVGKIVIYKMRSQYDKLKSSLDMDELTRYNYGINKVERLEHLPKAIIVDIDGTFAKINGRSPFDWDKVDTDDLNVDVADVVNTIADSGTKVILMSGRSSSARVKTIGWLAKHGINYDELHMRESPDFRKDYIVKRELFDKYVRDRYNIVGVFDDRDQVVHMWRKQLGLTVLQVDYGNF